MSDVRCEHGVSNKRPCDRCGARPDNAHAASLLGEAYRPVADSLPHSARIRLSGGHAVCFDVAGALARRCEAE